MKYLVVLCLVAFCAYEFTSVQASSSRPKRSVARGFCPKHTTTVAECVNHVRETGKANGCFEVSSDGEEYDITGCGVAVCEVDGEFVRASEDLTKPYPHCCPKC